MEYLALFEPAEEGGFVVTFPDFEWGITQGDSEDEARDMAQDALSSILIELIRNGKALPKPRLARGRKYRIIPLPAMESAKVELYTAFRESGLLKTDLAKRLQIPKTTVDRLFDFKNHTRMDQLDAAFAALGKKMRVYVQDAA